MNATNLQPKNTNVKYTYDYPVNREVAKYLTADDKQQISFRTGFTIAYVREWCRGTRRNKSIEEWARKIMKLNIAKQRKLNQSDAH